MISNTLKLVVYRWSMLLLLPMLGIVACSSHKEGLGGSSDTADYRFCKRILIQNLKEATGFSFFGRSYYCRDRKRRAHTDF